MPATTYTQARRKLVEAIRHLTELSDSNSRPGYDLAEELATDALTALEHAANDVPGYAQHGEPRGPLPTEQTAAKVYGND